MMVLPADTEPPVSNVARNATFGSSSNMKIKTPHKDMHVLQHNRDLSTFHQGQTHHKKKSGVITKKIEFFPLKFAFFSSERKKSLYIVWASFRTNKNKNAADDSMQLCICTGQNIGQRCSKGACLRGRYVNDNSCRALSIQFYILEFNYIRNPN